MKLRTKMFLLLAAVLAGFVITVLMGLQTVQEVRVGSSLYITIKENKYLLERIALLKAELNQVRAEGLNLILETDRDKDALIEQDIGELTETIEVHFAEALAQVQTEEKRIALEDAKHTWDEFSADLSGDFIALVRSEQRDAARELANGVQKMRYDRFIEQIGSMVDVLSMEVEEFEAAADQIVRSKMITSSAVSVLIFLVVVVLMLVVTRAITGPILTGAAFAQAVAAGDLSQELAVKAKDETGDLTRALNSMVNGLNGMVRRVRASAEELDHISQNIFTTSKRVIQAAQQQADSVDSTSSAITEINYSSREVGQGVETLAGLAGENTSSVLEMAASVEQVAGNVEALAAIVEEVGSSIAEMAASIGQVAANAGNLQNAAEVTASSIAEMDMSIRQVEQGAANTVAITEEVRRDAESGKTAADSTMEGMREIRRTSRTTAEVITALSGKAQNIGNILSVIDEVVDQINLLALNASIIAAQAGDHGKGFSVVAEEIRSLAERTGGSSREIATLIRGVQDETGRAVESIKQAEQRIVEGERLSLTTGEALGKIVQGVNKTTQQMGEVARATQEQSRSSQLIRQAMQKVSEMVAQIATATGEQDRASAQIMRAADRMKALTGEVKSSTREQSKAGGVIARASEEMTARIQQIRRACEEQARGSEQISTAVASIQDAASVNLEATKVMDGAVSGLRQQTRMLQTEMDAFQIMQEAQEEA